MLRSLRHRVAALRLSALDVALASVLAVAGVIWAVVALRSGAGTDPLTPLRINPLGPLPVKAPGPPIGFPPPPVLAPTPPPSWSPGSGDYLRPVLVNLIATLPVAIRRRLPYLAFIVAVGGILVLREGFNWPGFLGVMMCAYAAVAYGRHPVVATAILLAAAAVAAGEFSDSMPPMPGWLTPFAILAPIALAAAAIRASRARADAAARRVDGLERERDAAARTAIAEERARIARELHDVVSHHVSVMVIQAGGAGKVLEARPDLAAAALAAIESSGREAMAELRHLLGLVAPLDDVLRPQPGLADLDALVESVRATGQPVTVRRDVDRVSPGVDLTAYRVVQEALTNAMRHAPGAPTQVDLHREDDGTLVVGVRNDDPTRPRGGTVGSGMGLVGLRERLRLYGGTLDARRRIGGGFELRAEIPVDDGGVEGVAGARPEPAGPEPAGAIATAARPGGPAPAGTSDTEPVGAAVDTEPIVAAGDTEPIAAAGGDGTSGGGTTSGDNGAWGAGVADDAGDAGGGGATRAGVPG